MTDDLLAYLLDDLSPERRAAVDEKLATDFTWQRELARLEECLAAGSDPSECSEEALDEPPPDLVQKTCFLVEHSDDLPPTKNRRQGPASVSAFTDAPLGAAAKSWSLVDIAVAGGVLLLVVALVTPALFESRAAARRSVCQSHLYNLGLALFDYQDSRQGALPPVEPGESAGIYAVELLDDGRLTREQLSELLVCPESQLADDIFAGRVRVVVPTRQEYELADAAGRERMVATMGGSTAFRLGYRQRGQLQHPRLTGADEVPLAADAPLLSVAGVRSGNHVGGHNVLSESLNVGFQTDCMIRNRDDNFFLNRLGQPAAGRGSKDVVLVGSGIGPDGPIVRISDDD